MQVCLALSILCTPNETHRDGHKSFSQIPDSLLQRKVLPDFLLLNGDQELTLQTAMMTIFLLYSLCFTSEQYPGTISHKHLRSTHSLLMAPKTSQSLLGLYQMQHILRTFIHFFQPWKKKSYRKVLSEQQRRLMSLTAHHFAAVQPLAPSKNTSLKPSFLLGVLWVTPCGSGFTRK